MRAFLDQSRNKFGGGMAVHLVVVFLVWSEELSFFIFMVGECQPLLVLGYVVILGSFLVFMAMCVIKFFVVIYYNRRRPSILRHPFISFSLHTVRWEIDL